MFDHNLHDLVRSHVINTVMHSTENNGLGRGSGVACTPLIMFLLLDTLLQGITKHGVHHVKIRQLCPSSADWGGLSRSRACLVIAELVVQSCSGP